jgi:UDP-N-acetylglucosamine diphosphorylase/glucosamine-1-phosphate N-acetyltransferase
MTTPHAKPLAIVIMAAGKGTRMKSDAPKALAPLLGKPLVGHVIDVAKQLDPSQIVVVVGHKREMVEKVLATEPVLFAMQEPQLGTGHAVQCAMGAIPDFVGDVMVLSGDVPLIAVKTVAEMQRRHREKNAAVTILSCILDNGGMYGRIKRDQTGDVIGNVEAKDATPAERALTEINSGVYIFDSLFLHGNVSKLSSKNAQGEYYLTDLIRLAYDAGFPIADLVLTDPTEITGINTKEELAALEQSLSKK